MSATTRRLRKRMQRRTRPWKPRIQSAEGRLRRQRVIHVLHIGKTGGLALKEAIRGDVRGVQSVYQDAAPGARILTHSHFVTLADVPRGDDVVVTLRDPVTRFVSGFNSRQREGRPKHFNAWKPPEKRAFERFGSPDALATALGAEDPVERAEAEAAMGDIGHVRTHLSDWLGSPESIHERRSDLLLVAWQETLGRDFERLRELVGLVPTLRLPADPRTAHRAPSTQSTDLSLRAEQNLRAWYRQDDALIDALVEMGLTRLPAAVIERRERVGR